ncbi:MAG: pyruvate dehydrogenase (acetyl-transferring) E1 component subunit alpha [Simkaniaceae bacterium]
MSEKYHFYKCDKKKLIASLGPESLIRSLEKMLLIRNFEVRAESAYQQGQIGGFFHAYIGQEAIQTSAFDIFGLDAWWITTYRCHALALLTGATPDEIMAEFYGRKTGNAKGRGGSMHLYTDRLLGGFGIVGGHLPIATGAAFSLKYLNEEGKVALCFMGEGAVAQGAVHESLNLASLWSLPCIYVIENNKWGMGTAVNRAIAVEPIAENMAKGYAMESLTLDGMDYFSCYAGFEKAKEIVLGSKRPVLIEIITERFRGHSISDPGLYRSKEALKQAMEKDPIKHLVKDLDEEKMITDEEYETLNKKQKEMVLNAMKFAESSDWPDPITLEEDILA